VESLVQQTIFPQTQIIIADNLSTDGSDRLSEQLLANIPNALFVQNGCNRGFGAGSNMAVKHATGRFLFFLNPDVWLEPDCLEQLCAAARDPSVGVVSALVLDYDSNQFQTAGATGFDLCGYMFDPATQPTPKILYSSHGFCFLSRELFERIGGYEENFFLYCEELDLSWRARIAGKEVVYADAARMHHRGAAAENPKGGTRIVEIRTSNSKRFYANRNHLITLLKNAQHIRLLHLIPALAQMFFEGIGGMILLRRWSFFSRTFWDAIAGCWRLRRYLIAERRRIRSYRQCGDFQMLRFLSWRFNRWIEVKRFCHYGLPKVDNR
jgi:GT2 family glycosyltransferase